MLNIVIPMAGAGSRFFNAGFMLPKPLIEIHGCPMIKIVVDNLKPNQSHRFIFICQKSHATKYSLREKLNSISKNSIIIEIDNLTDGAACTVLMAKEYINNSDPLMIANSDQFVDLDINLYLSRLAFSDLDGIIMTMSANDPKWSYVGLNEQNFVSRVVEKEVISSNATIGIYNFRRGQDFVFAAEEMISKNLRVKNEFYVAPAYNILINQGYRVGIFNAGSEKQGVYGLGTPEDLDFFLNNKASSFLVT